jgi:hypothetical protein
LNGIGVSQADEFERMTSGAYELANNQKLLVTKPLELTVSWDTLQDSAYCTIILQFAGCFLVKFFIPASFA